jgi:hypothetical protein
VRKLVAIMMVAGMTFFALSILATAQEGEESQDVHQYVGAAKCKVCHNSEAKGAQYTKWEASKHAKAFEVLASEEAIAAGKELGVDNPQTSDKCLICHVTGFSAPAEAKAESFDQTEGVGCEACHGPGSDYKSMKIMKDLDAAMAAGMIVPNEETCRGCHNENSPTFKEFNFAESFKVIAHPYPEKEE